MIDFHPLIAWFLAEGRDLPWRRDKTPYRVWVSEVMLQQTQASVVISYFHRWMQKFPTLELLAAAPQEEVMKAWEGLGYYARARNLHAAAKKIMECHGGEIPSTPAQLSELKGFGPYTTGAVLSFAFGQRAAAVDGNTVRVLSRLLALENDASHRSFYQERAEELLPSEGAPLVMEGLIELGALVCQKKPRCDLCPLKKQCQAHRQGIEGELPRKRKSDTIIPLCRTVGVIVCQGSVLLKQESIGKVMGGLYEFPFVPQGEGFSFDLPLEEIKQLPLVKHSFTRYRVTLFPKLFHTSVQKKVADYSWVSWEKVESLPFSSGHKRILTGLKNENFTH